MIPPSDQLAKAEDPDAGMTLVEVLAVLAILSLAAVVAMPMVRPPSPERTLEMTAAEIARRARAVRAAAIAANGEGRILVDVDTRAIDARVGEAEGSQPGGRAFQLPAGMTVTVTAAAADVEPGRIAAIRFFPDGSSTGGRIALLMGERRHVVAVDWLSGRVTSFGAETRGGGP